MREIDADALVKILREQAAKTPNTGIESISMEVFMKIAELVDAMPTIEERRGEWKCNERGHQWCSECNANRPTDGHVYLAPTYCPSCGAKMKNG